MARVYVSSTFIDLEHHRASAISALRRAGHVLAVMEDYPAFDERPADRCMCDVASCDVYICIVAFRYGFIPPQNNPNGTSITELEYIAAEGKKRLIFQLDPEVPWPRKFSDEVTGEAEYGKRIERFRTRLSIEHGNRYFKSPEDLATQVLAAISSLDRPFSDRIPPEVNDLITHLNLKLLEKEQQLLQQDRHIEWLTQQISQTRPIEGCRPDIGIEGRDGTR